MNSFINLNDIKHNYLRSNSFKLAPFLLIFLLILIPLKANGQSINFTGTQIGSTTATNSFSYNGSYYTVNGSGSGVGLQSDSTYFVNTGVNGNIEITANLSSLPAGSANYAQAGLMLRQTQGSPSDTNDANAFVYITPGNGINFSYRTISGGQTTTVLGPSLSGPVYLKLARNSQNVTAYYSNNGSSWTNLGSCSLNLSGNYYAGFSVNSNNTTATMQAQFNNFNLSIDIPQVSSNLALWLRSDFGVSIDPNSSSNGISSVQDLSNYHYNFSQNTFAYEPTLVANAQNNLPAINFNPVNYQNLQSAPNAISNDFSGGVTVFMVAKPILLSPPAAGNQFMLDLGNYLNNDIALALPFAASNETTLTFHAYNGTTDNSITTPNTVGLNSFQLFEATQGSSVGNIFLNGSLSVNAALNNPLSNITRGNNTLGGLPNGVNVGQYYFNGQIAEVLVYQGQLNQAQRQSVENYLLFKYNLYPYPAPQISVGGNANVGAGVYSTSQTITITAPAGSSPQSAIYYTLDGSIPTTSSNLYTGPFTLSQPANLVAMVITPYTQSPTATCYIDIDQTAGSVIGIDPQVWLMGNVGVNLNAQGNVSGWQNLANGSNSINNFNFYQANSSLAPTYNSSDVGNLPSVGFNAANSQILTSPITNSSNYANGFSVFAVVKTTTLPNKDSRIFDFGNAYNNDIAFGLSYSNTYNLPTLQVYQGLGDSVLVGPNSVSQNSAYILGGIQSGSNTGYIYFNSSQSSAGTLQNALSGINRSSNAIGGVETGSGTSGNNFTGNISELLIFPQPLSQTQIQQVEIYLANKYNLGVGPTLPAPSSSVATGVYPNAQNVTLTTSVPGLNIYYTLDGSVPTLASNLYTVPLSITTSTLLRARTIVNSNYYSADITNSYICIDPNTTNVPQTGLQLWLRADFGVSQSSNYVSGWQDLSGNNFNFSQSSTNLPKLTANAINGQSAISFNGTQILDGPSTSTNYSGGVSVFAVIKPTGLSTSAPDTRIIDLGNVFNNDIAYGITYNSLKGAFNPKFYIYNSSSANNIQSGNVISNNSNYLFEAFQNGTSVGSIYTNGLEQIQAALNNAVNQVRYNNGVGGVNTADGGDGSNNFNGYIAEILVYNTELSSTQRQAVESYLSQKYVIGPGPTLNPPTISVATGVYSTSQSVSITQSGNPYGTNIYYTTDGSTPTTSSTLYTGPITINEPITLNAVTGQDYATSSVSTSYIDVDISTANIPRTDLQGWYMANCGITTTGTSTVTSWLDLSGNSFNFNLGTSGSYPIINSNIFNGYPAVNFNSSQILGANPTSVNYSNGVSVFIVAEPIDLSIVDMRMFNLGNYNGSTSTSVDNISPGIYYYSGSDYSSFQVYNGTYGNRLILGPSIASGGHYLFETFQLGSDNLGFVYLNGNKPANPQTLYPPSIPSTGNRVNNGIGGVFLGAGSTGTNNFNGNIAEILVYNSALSQAEITSIEAYLCNKYNLANTHIAFNSPTFSINSGVYTTSQTVTISQSGNPPGTQIHYTTDGTTPNNSSPLYTGPITVNSTTIIQAIASMSFGSSNIASNYICIDPSTAGLPTANLNLWLRADFGVTQSSGAVSGWQDLSGNNFNFNQFTASYKPTYVASDINNKPGVSFNGSQILLGGNNANDYSNGASVFVVTKASNPSNSDARFFDFGNDENNDIAFGEIFTSNYLPAFHIYNGTTNNYLSGSNSLNAGSVYVLDAIQTGSADTANIYYNGGLSATGSLNYPQNVPRGFNAIGGVNTGSGYGANNYKGDIAEILVYNTALTDSQRVAVESYLSNKYGLSEGPAIAAPTVTPGNTVSPTPVTITMTQVNPPVGGIYYTTDGTTPNAGSNKYTGPFQVSQDSQIVSDVITSWGSSSSATSLIQIDPLSGYVPRSNLVLWLKSDYAVTVASGSNNVTAWTDMSGNNFDFIQSNASYQPTYLSMAINNKYAVSFNSSNFQALEGYSTNIDFSSGVSAFVVAKPNSVSLTNQSFFDFGNFNVNDIAFGLLGTNPAIHIFQGTTDKYITGTNAVNAGQWQLFETLQGSNLANIFINSLIQGNGTLTNSASGITRSANGVGGAPNGSSVGDNYFNGQIAEILVYNANLSLEDQGAIEAYLMNKYQLFTQAPSAPTFSIANTSLNQVSIVSIASSPNATIYYTTDGSTPTTGSSQYTGPITINSSTLIKAIAVANGQSSAVSSIQYNLDSNKFPQASTSPYTTPLVDTNKPATTTP